MGGINTPGGPGECITGALAGCHCPPLLTPPARHGWALGLGSSQHPKLHRRVIMLECVSWRHGQASQKTTGLRPAEPIPAASPRPPTPGRQTPRLLCPHSSHPNPHPAGPGQGCPVREGGSPLPEMKPMRVDQSKCSGSGRYPGGLGPIRRQALGTEEGILAS